MKVVKKFDTITFKAYGCFEGFYQGKFENDSVPCQLMFGYMHS